MAVFRYCLCFLLLVDLAGCKWLSGGDTSDEDQPVVNDVTEGDKPVETPSVEVSSTASLELLAYESGVLRLSYRNTGDDLIVGDKYEVRFLIDDEKPDADCVEATVGYAGEVPKPERMDFRIEMRGIKDVKALKNVRACLVRVSDKKMLVVQRSPILLEDPAAPIAGAPEIVNYARICREAIGPVPTSDCRDGQLMPIKVNGEAVDSLPANADCDDPVELDMPNGQCVPGSRLLLMENHDPDVQIIMVCRRYAVRPPESLLYEDISIIQHRKSTGATCFYQMPNNPTDGSRVPDPTELPAETPAGKIQSNVFWLTPKLTAERTCIKCHDSDPFIYNPWSRQMKGLPANPKGKYVIIGREFADWPIATAISTDGGNACTDCHRIGNMKTCELLDSSVGRLKTPNQAAAHFKFPTSYWMPPGHNLATIEDWTKKFGKDYDALAACCGKPDSAGCTSKAISINRGY